MTGPRTTAETLVELEALRQLKARYCLFLDSHSYTDLRRQFTADAVVRGTNTPFARAGSERTLSADEFIDNVQSEHRDHALRFHTLHIPLMSVPSPDQGFALWPFSTFSLRGYYDEEYRREAGVWKICAMHLIVIVPHDLERLEREAARFSEVAADLAAVAGRWGQVQ